MKMRGSVWVVISAALLFVSSPAYAGEFRIPVGGTYVSNFDDVSDLFIENLESLGYTVTSSGSTSAGLSVQPYYQFESGLGAGVAIGPIMAISAQSYSLLSLPVGLDARYTMFRSSPVSPYVRAGARYIIISGDFVKGSNPGVYGSIGAEFMKNVKWLNMGAEISYDTSEIEMENLTTNRNETIRVLGVMVSVFAVF